MSKGATKSTSEKVQKVKLPSRQEAMAMLKEAGADDKLIAHCRAVTALAVKIASKCKGEVDIELVKIGSLLHDIGRTSNHGITHGVEGAKMLRKLGLPAEVVRIAERHIGGGLTTGDAERLGLPKKSYVPKTLEEKIVAHADNLISGSKRAPVSEAISHMIRLQEVEAARRILSLHKELSELCGRDLDRL